MDVSDEHDPERDDGEQSGERSATGRKKRSDAGKPRGGSSSRKPSSRFERRAKKAEETVRSLVELGKPKLDISDLTFSEVVHRDAPAWGQFIAQLGEWIIPFGAFVDLVFGQPLMILLRMAPSVRAARRDLANRRERIAAARAEAAEEEALRERIEAEHAAHAGDVFAGGPMPPEESDAITREAWLARGGAVE